MGFRGLGSGDTDPHSRPHICKSRRSSILVNSSSRSRFVAVVAVLAAVTQQYSSSNTSSGSKSSSQIRGSANGAVSVTRHVVAEMLSTACFRLRLIISEQNKLTNSAIYPASSVTSSHVGTYVPAPTRWQLSTNRCVLFWNDLCSCDSEWFRDRQDPSPSPSPLPAPPFPSETRTGVHTNYTD